MRTRGARLLAGVLIAPLLYATEVWARTVVRVGSSDQPNAGRVILDVARLSPRVTRDGTGVAILFAEDTEIGPLPPPPRNVVALRVLPGGVALSLTPGAIARDRRVGRQLIIDIDDAVAARPPAGKPERRAAEATAQAGAGPQAVVLAGAEPGKAGQPPASPAPAPPSSPAAPGGAPEKILVIVPGVGAVVPAASAATDPRPAPDPRPTTATGPDQAPALTQTAIPLGPVALAATKARPPLGLIGAAMRVPFAEPVGAAAFTRGMNVYAVFDERRPIDLAALRDDPVFGSAEVAVHPAATVIRVPLAPGQQAVLARAGAGWLIAVTASAASPAPLTAVAAKGTLTFAAAEPGQVVAIPDPGTAGTLIVGTQRKSGQAVRIDRRTAEFVLPSTGQGIVVEPLSDTIALRVTQSGFVLTGGPDGLALSPAQAMAETAIAAARLTRRYEFPGQTTADLAWRARRQAVAAAAAPPLARGPKRRALAETLVALGMSVEAQTALKVAVKDDPREAGSPDTAGLAAIAAILANRLDQSGGLADPRLTGTDEIALWRAIQAATRDEKSPEAAAVLAATAPLVFTYPEEIRRRVLPLVLETMALGGQADAAAHWLTERETDPTLAFARGLVKQAKGDVDGALKIFDAVAGARDSRDHARAAVRAVEARLTKGELTAKTAAEALDKLLYAWRGDRRDLELRLRLAELWRQDGNWRALFSLLRAAKAEFPANAADIDRRMKEAFAALPKDKSIDAMPPTDLILMLEDNADLMEDGPEGEPIRVRLAEKLMALDLPKRADAVLTKLMRAAPIGPARAEFGATLAGLRLRESDPSGALVALGESNSADIPEAARSRRALIAARVDAGRGDLAGAVDTLAGVPTAEADEARAAILEQAKDWPRAQEALRSYVGRVVPAEGALDEPQRRAVLRLATAAARAGDDAALASLRERMKSRIGTGPNADLFRLLTAEPVRGTADLSRARAEIGLVRAVTRDLGARKPP